MARRRENLLDTKSGDTPVEVTTVDSVSVPQYVTGRRIPGEGIHHLLRGPLYGRMLCDIEMNDTPTIVTEDDDDKQNSEGCSRQSEEVDRHQVLHMIVEKAPPSLGRWLPMANHVLGHGGLRNRNAPLRQLTRHEGAPRRGLDRLIVPDQLAYFGSDARSAGTTSPGIPCPVASEPRPVPLDDRLGLHDDEDLVPVGPDSVQQHPETTVQIRESRPFCRAMEDGELLSPGEILESQRAARSESREERAKKRRNHAGVRTSPEPKDQEGCARTNQ